MKEILGKCAVLGGDRRQVYLARSLAEKGFRVRCFGLPEGTAWEGCETAGSLEEALFQADIVAGPVPFYKATGIFGFEREKSLTEDGILKYMKKNSLFFGGGLSQAFQRKAEQAGIYCIDFMKEEQVIIGNTRAAAEGILAEAVKRSPSNLGGSSCIVIGYGACGRTLTDYLKAIGCCVTVIEKDRERALWAGMKADKTAGPAGLEKAIEDASYIFNTAPALVLKEALLKRVRKDTLILDLASFPGGVDYQAAEREGIQAVLLPGLPGIYAPRSSGEILAEAVLERWNQKIRRQEGLLWK